MNDLIILIPKREADEKWASMDGIIRILRGRINTTILEYPSKNETYLKFEKALSSFLKNKESNVLCFCAGENFSLDNVLSNLKMQHSFNLIYELGDEPQTRHFNQFRASFSDYLFTPDLQCFSYYIGKGKKVIWLNHYCDTNIFFYDETIPRDERLIVTTVGSKRRYALILRLLFGGRFKNQRINPTQSSKYFSQGLIGYQYARYSEITRRIFELGGCKTLVITNKIPEETGIYSLFTPGVDIDFYDGFFDLIRTILRAFIRKERTKQLAENLHKKILNYHTETNRAEDLLRIFK